MKCFLALLILFSIPVSAQIETTEQNFQESKAILKDIQKENFFKKGSFDFRTGLLQVSANKPNDPLKLNSRNELPFLEIGYTQQLYKNWGLTASFMHSQNMLGTGTLNGTSASLQSYQVGAHYRIILDETMIKNYVLFKFQYYGMSNNFKLGNAQDFFLKSETGFLLGVERSLPATELFDIRGAFDFLYITAADTESILDYREHGNGLQLRADIFYNYSKVSRWGLGYSISAFFNKYSDPGFEARDRHTQTYKALYLSYNYLF